jgi:hypothetical protein
VENAELVCVCVCVCVCEREGGGEREREREWERKNKNIYSGIFQCSEPDKFSPCLNATCLLSSSILSAHLRLGIGKVRFIYSLLPKYCICLSFLSCESSLTHLIHFLLIILRTGKAQSHEDPHYAPPVLLSFQIQLSSSDAGFQILTTSNSPSSGSQVLWIDY